MYMKNLSSLHTSSLTPFAWLYGDAVYLEQPLDTDLIKGNWGKCFVCEGDTPFVSLSFEAHICCAFCETLAWQAYLDSFAEYERRKQAESPALPTPDAPMFLAETRAKGIVSRAPSGEMT